MTELRLDPETQGFLSRLTKFFGERGITAYATGGFLRDGILGAPVHDIDISISESPLVIGPQIAEAFGGHSFALREEEQQSRIILPELRLHIDLLPLRGTIEEDLRLRDYTIDAMAAPLGSVVAGSPDVIDPLGGLADLRAGIVRVVSEEAFRLDPLRTLRGARIATQLAFQIEPGTRELIARHAELLPGVAAERQREELMRIFATPRAGAAVRLLNDLGLLARVLPEMDVTRGAEQPKEHYWDVFGHSIAAVENMDALLADEQPANTTARDLWRELWPQLGWWEEARAYFGEELAPGITRQTLLKLTCLLHDIGKPATRTIDETGRMRFFGHSDVGADIAAGALRRLRFSAREVTMVRAMIEAHLRPVQMAQQGPPTRRAVYRFFRDTADAGIETLFLSLADHLGTVGPAPEHGGLPRARGGGQLRAPDADAGRDAGGAAAADPGR